MLTKSTFSGHVLMGLIALGLAGCASPDGEGRHMQHHTGGSANMVPQGPSGASSAQPGMMSGTMGSHGGSGMMGAGTAGAQGEMQHMDKASMCAMHRNMQNAPNEQARQAIMDRQMQGMSPEMRQRQMDMMRQQCQ
jgi:hypothetical protein